MGEHVIKLPDVGEGVAEAELVEWHVKVGDLVREDAMLAAVMTDKATVEIPSPVDGEILWLGAEIGDTVAVGSPLVRLKVAGEGNAKRGHGRRKPRRPKRRRSRPKPRPQPGHGRSRQAGRSRRRSLRAVAGRAETRPATLRRAASGGRKAAGVAGRAAARARGRHRPAAGRGHAVRPAASPMRISRRSWRAGRRCARRRGLAPQRRGRGHQGRRPAPQDRREDGARQIAHPAHHLCRGDRRHRAGGIARRAQQGEARRTGRS